MSTAPSAAAVTRPVGDTVATTGLDDCQTARLVTSATEPSELDACAKSCSLSPGATVVAALPAVPTWTLVTVTPGDGAGEGVGFEGVVGCVGGALPPHAVARPATDTARTRRTRTALRRSTIKAILSSLIVRSPSITEEGNSSAKPVSAGW